MGFTLPCRSPPRFHEERVPRLVRFVSSADEFVSPFVVSWNLSSPFLLSLCVVDIALRVSTPRVGRRYALSSHSSRLPPDISHRDAPLITLPSRSLSLRSSVLTRSIPHPAFFNNLVASACLHPTYQPLPFLHLPQGTHVAPVMALREEIAVVWTAVLGVFEDF